MSIFTNKLSVNDDAFESEIVACEGYDFELGGNYDAMMESYDDDLAIIESMHAFEMAELEAMKESGSVEVATPIMESSLKDIWAKIKAFFVNLGKRIMAFFRSVKDYIVSIVASGSEFAKKYKERLDKVKLTNFTYEMYDYKIRDNFKTGTTHMKATNKKSEEYVNMIKGVQIKGDHVLAKLNSIENTLDSSKEELLADLRKKLSGSAVSNEEYTKALFETFRSGGKKKSVSVTSLSQYVEFLEKSDDLNKTIKEAHETVKSTFANIEKSINEAAREAETSTKGGEYSQAGAKKAALMRSQLKTFASAQSLFTRYVSAWSTAAKEATGTYKSLCYKALTHKG